VPKWKRLIGKVHYLDHCDATTFPLDFERADPDGVAVLIILLRSDGCTQVRKTSLIARMVAENHNGGHNGSL
jgi:hypothetical protein